MDAEARRLSARFSSLTAPAAAGAREAPELDALARSGGWAWRDWAVCVCVYACVRG
jgi:hypothetical protein